MTAEESMKGNIKMTVFDVFPTSELTKVCEAMRKLGYDSYIVSNGNIVFQKLKSIPIGGLK